MNAMHRRSGSWQTNAIMARAGVENVYIGYDFMKFILVIWTLLLSVNAYAATNNLPDCAQATVQNAINSSSDRDVLACPAGSWSWSSVSIVNRNITLQGAGIGITNISITAGGGIGATSNNTKAFRITGFTFTSTGNFGTDSGWALMMIQGGHGWRIDHNRFVIYADVISYNGGNGIYTKNDVSGLIDHNRFEKGGGPGCMHASTFIDQIGTVAWGWASGQISAFDHTVFIEDNYFYNPDACSAHNAHAFYGTGGIYVARHNEIHGMNQDSHGLCATQGTREYEVSSNTWIGVPGNTLYAVLHPRGGTGVMYNNSWSGSLTYGYWFEEYRTQPSPPCSTGVTYNVPGFGVVTASSSCPEGYPCAQQIGRGQNNSSDPLYIWNNSGSSNLRNDAPSYIQSGRDYYLNQGAKPGYTPYPYPHPLAAAGSTSLLAPTNLRATQ
jgi:hypothetical protein